LRHIYADFHDTETESGRDENGSRQPGWIQANQVAIATTPPSRDSLPTSHEELGAVPTAAEPWRNGSRQVEREMARKTAEDARAAVLSKRPPGPFDEARRKYESLTKKPEEAPPLPMRACLPKGDASTAISL
jgi:hypothetical protein